MYKLLIIRFDGKLVIMQKNQPQIYLIIENGTNMSCFFVSHSLFLGT